MTTKTHEQWLLAWHAYPADCHDLASLRRFLAYFREMHATSTSETQRANLRTLARTAEQAIARHPDLFEEGLNDDNGTR